MFHAREPVTVCDQFIHLITSKGEHELSREPIGIALNSLVKSLRRHPIQFRQIAVEHDLDATNGKYSRTYRFRICGFHWCQVSHFLAVGNWLRVVMARAMPRRTTVSILLKTVFFCQLILAKAASPNADRIRPRGSAPLPNAGNPVQATPAPLRLRVKKFSVQCLKVKGQ